MFSGQADANGKIVRTDTGEILAVVPSARGKKPHISESTAGTMAANQAAEELGKKYYFSAHNKMEHTAILY